MLEHWTLDALGGQKMAPTDFINCGVIGLMSVSVAISIKRWGRGENK
jgi:hypothetical protein